MSSPILSPEHKPSTPRRTLRDRKERAATAASRWDIENEVTLLRHIYRADFWSFFLYCFGAGTNPKGKRWIDPAVHEPLARWFQLHIDDWLKKRSEGIVEQKHLAILVHREVGKTTMITQAGQAWLHLRDPEISSYTGSEKIELAQTIIRGIKSVFDGSDPYSQFSKLYGNWAAGASTWTAREVVHTGRKNVSRRDPSIGTFAVETSIVGAHPDAYFYDDPISYERLGTDTNWLQTVNDQISSLIPVIQSDGLVVWVGTRYDDNDHFGVGFRNDGVKSVTGMKTDAIEPREDGVWHVYFMAGRGQDGKPTTPKVWPEQRLLHAQKNNPLRYASQIMNDPAISEMNPITQEQINQCIIDEKEVPWGALDYSICTDIAFWDGDKRISKDESAIVVHGYPRNGSGDVYVVEVHADAYWRQEDFFSKLVSLVQRYRHQGKRIKGISGETARAGLKGVLAGAMRSYFNDAGVPMPQYFEFERGNTKKEARLTVAAGYWVDGHVRVVRTGPNVKKLTDQMKNIGQYMVNRRTKIDIADAHSDAFQPEFYQVMRRSQQKAPYLRGAVPIDVEGLETELFEDGEYSDWASHNPREPIRA